MSKIFLVAVEISKRELTRIQRFLLVDSILEVDDGLPADARVDRIVGEHVQEGRVEQGLHLHQSIGSNNHCTVFDKGLRTKNLFYLRQCCGSGPIWALFWIKSNLAWFRIRSHLRLVPDQILCLNLLLK